MKDELSAGALWNEAAKAGLYFGAISVSYIGLSELVGMIGSPVLQGFVKTVCWAGKLTLCIWLMVFLMKRLVGKYSGVGNSDTLRFGIRTALLSALIVASAYALIAILTPADVINKEFDAALAQVAGQLDSNSLDVIENFKENLPIVFFFSEFIYCSFFGLILSLIISRRVPSQNPFTRDDVVIEDDSPEEQGPETE